MPIYIEFSTPREACTEIEEIAAFNVDTAVARPWNRYEPDRDIWWLVPSTDWPAYKYGKFHFGWGHSEQSSLFISLYFEKGLGSCVSDVYSCPRGLRQIMDENWAWYRLIDNLENGKLSTRILTLAQDLPIPLKMTVDGGFVQDPSGFDPAAPDLPWDRYCFELDAAAREFMIRHSQTDTGLLAPLSELRKLDELSGILHALDANDWLWVNLHFGISLCIRGEHEPEGQVAVWKATDLWNNFFRYLLPWFI